MLAVKMLYEKTRWSTSKGGNADMQEKLVLLQHAILLSELRMQEYQPRVTTQTSQTGQK